MALVVAGKSRQHLACFKSDSVTLSSPGAAHDELALSASWCGEDVTAGAANDGLRVRENSHDFTACWAQHVHEERVGCLNESMFALVHVGLLGRVHIQKVHLHCALKGLS